MSGLNGIVENGAVMICPFSPQQLHPCVPNLLYPDYTRRPWDPWKKDGINVVQLDPEDP